MGIKKIGSWFKKYFPLPSLVLYSLALVSGVIHIISEFSTGFSDFFNRYIASFFRGVLATVSSIFPFSLAEVLIVTIPVWFVSVLVICTRRTKRDVRSGGRFVAMMAGVLSLLYTMFVLTTVVAYNGTTLASKLGLTPSECLIFEDATTGIMAARAAKPGAIVAVYDKKYASPLTDGITVDRVYHDHRLWRETLADYGLMR